MALDCCDRGCLATVGQPRDLRAADSYELMRRAVAARFGTGCPPVPVQWLSDTERMYTALDTVIHAERLHLVPITTPARSPQTNGMSEAGNSTSPATAYILVVDPNGGSAPVIPRRS